MATIFIFFIIFTLLILIYFLIKTTYKYVKEVREIIRIDKLFLEDYRKLIEKKRQDRISKKDDKAISINDKLYETEFKKWKKRIDEASYKERMSDDNDSELYRILKEIKKWVDTTIRKKPIYDEYNSTYYVLKEYEKWRNSQKDS